MSRNAKATERVEALLAEALASNRAGNFPQAERRYSDILEIEDRNPQVLTLFRLPDLVTQSLDEYEARSLGLARDRTALSEIRSRLARNRETRPLFDTARFARHLEAAYLGMVERYRSGEAPETFAVDALGENHV